MISVIFSFILFFIFSFVYSSVSLSSFSVFFLFLCLCVMLYVLLCCVAVCRGVVCAVLCVCCVVSVCGAAWHAEPLLSLSMCTFQTLRVSIQNLLRVCQQHAHMLFNMWAWCRYTRDVSNLHTGGVLSLHTGSSPVLLTKKSPRTVLTCPREVHQKKRKNLTHFFEFERRSTTASSRFLQSFTSPDEAVQLQLS